MIKKLKIRFVIIMMGLISMILSGILLSLITSSKQHMLNDSYDTLDNLYTLNYMNETPKIESNFIIGRDNIYNFFIQLSESGEVLRIRDSRNLVTEEIAYEILETVTWKNENKGVLKEYGLIYKKYDENLIGFIDYSHEENFMQRQVRSYLFIITGSFAVFVIVSLYLSKLAVKPVEVAWKKQQQFVMDASHELKTPLTVIKANISIIKSNIEESDGKWIRNVESEVNQMQSLLDDLLMLAKLDSATDQIEVGVVSISDIAFESAMAFEPVFFDAGHELNIDIDQGVMVKGSSAHLRRLIIILLDNAKKYSFDKIPISIKLKRNGKNVILSVNNFGEIIPDQAKKNIFDRFYMEDKSRSRTGNSYGLGLAIAKEIVNMHDGKISLVSDEVNGTTFVISLDAI